MTLEIHHMGAIEGPQLDHLIVRDRCEAIQLWYFAEAAHDILVSDELLLHDPVVPEANFLVLAARNGDAIGKGED